MSVEVYSEIVPLTISTDQGHPGHVRSRDVFGNSYAWCCYSCGAEQRAYRSLVGADRAADDHRCPVAASSVVTPEQGEQP